MKREKTVLDETDKKKLNEKAVLIYLDIQKNKAEFEDTIEEEYIEKVREIRRLKLFYISYLTIELNFTGHFVWFYCGNILMNLKIEFSLTILFCLKYFKAF